MRVRPQGDLHIMIHLSFLDPEWGRWAKTGNDGGDAHGMGGQTLNDLPFLEWPQSTSRGLQAVGTISRPHPGLPSILPHLSTASSLLARSVLFSPPARFGPRASAGLAGTCSPLSGLFKLDFSTEAGCCLDRFSKTSEYAAERKGGSWAHFPPLWREREVARRNRCGSEVLSVRAKLWSRRLLRNAHATVQCRPTGA